MNVHKNINLKNKKKKINYVIEIQHGQKLNQKLDKIQIIKNYASNQPEFYRPSDNDDDDGGPANLTAKEIEQEAREASRTLQKGKPTLRRKSELPHDYATLNALEKHKRPNEFLNSASEANPNAQ